jgi:hypothetical protein
VQVCLDRTGGQSGLLPSFTHTGPMSRTRQLHPRSRLPHGIERAAWVRENCESRGGGIVTAVLDALEVRAWVSPIFDGCTSRP